jgi:hypothetical protein
VGNEGFSSGPHLHATLSDTVKGVFNGTVYDLYKYLSTEIKKASQVKPAVEKTPAPAQKVVTAQKVAAAPTETTKTIYACPHCKKELK